VQRCGSYACGALDMPGDMTSGIQLPRRTTALLARTDSPEWGGDSSLVTMAMPVLLKQREMWSHWAKSAGKRHGRKPYRLPVPKRIDSDKDTK
jgi:hypothetical protein